MAQLAVVAHVLAEQDPIAVAAVEKLQQEVDHARLAVLLGGLERHAQEVELDRGSALDQPQVVVESWVAVCVADHDPTRVDAFLLENGQLERPYAGLRRVGRDREPRAPRCPGNGAEDALLGGRHPRLVGPDLAQDADPDPGLADPGRRFADQLLGELVRRAPVDPRLGRVVGVAIPAAAQDQVEPRCRGQSCQPARIPAHAVERQVAQGRTAGLAEEAELVEDHRLVAGELPVVVAPGDLPQGDLRVLVGKDEAQRRRVDGAEDGHHVRHDGIVPGRIGTGAPRRATLALVQQETDR